MKAFPSILFVLSALTMVNAAPPALSLEDAVARTLASNPGVEIQRARITQAEGSLLSASGRFDWNTSLRLSDSLRRTPGLGAFPGGSIFDIIDFKSVNELLVAINRDPIVAPAGAPAYAVQREEQRTVTLGATRQLRNGITILPAATVFDYQVNTNPLPAAVRSEWGVEFVVPLARGLGRESAAAYERAAQIGVDAARVLAGHGLAERVARTAAAYWDCLAAERRLALLVDTEHRARDLVALVGDLVRSGEVEPAVRLEADAEAMRRRSETINGEMELFAARQRLGVALGLKPEELPDAPTASGEFPPAAAMAADERGVAALVAQAMVARGDLRAVDYGRKVEEVYAARARNEIRPRVDLNLRAGYAGGVLGDSLARYGPALTSDLTGTNVSAALSVEWPTANRGARGNLLRRNAQVREAELSTAELATAIAADVAIAHAALRTAAQQYGIARDGVAALGEVLANQRRKLQLGEIGLTALVQNEDRYFQARTSLITASRNYAVAVLDLRRVTGTLVAGDGRGNRLSLTALTTPPPTTP